MANKNGSIKVLGAIVFCCLIIVSTYFVSKEKINKDIIDNSSDVMQSGTVTDKKNQNQTQTEKKSQTQSVTTKVTTSPKYQSLNYYKMKANQKDLYYELYNALNK